MATRRLFLLAGLSVSVAPVLAPSGNARAQASAAGRGGTVAEPAYVLGATAISQVFGDGQRLVGVAIEYDRPVDPAVLDPALYAVEGRTVTRVHASAAPEPSDRGGKGRFVVVDLSPDDQGARLYAARSGGGILRRPAAATVTVKLRSVPAPAFLGTGAAAPQGAGAQGGPRGGPPAFGSEPLSLPTNAARNLVVDDFTRGEFHDSGTGDILAYNLFVPRDRDPSVPLPLVLFMHDAGVTGTAVDATLVQGLGAVSWASPEDQAKHPAIVLAPQYRGQIVNDESQTTSMLETTLHLLDHVAREHNADRSRFYVTGQSGGGMMGIAMIVKEPDLFAAAFLVACQWDPAVVRPLARQKLWIMVSAGDEKAYPGQNAIMAVIEGEGAKVSRATWDGTSTPGSFVTLVEAQASQGMPINYTVLRQGTVVPSGEQENGGANHMNTWRIAYAVPGIRDWIMQQRRGG